MTAILAVCHSPSNNTNTLAESLLLGLRTASEGRLSLRPLTPLSAGPQDLLEAAAIIIGTTENFGSMAGLSKDFFERIYYPCLERTQGLPAAVYIRAGQDGRGSAAQIEKIFKGLGWRLVQPVLFLRGPYQVAFERQVQTLGETMAAGIEAGIF